jgi:hypothetical protein
MYRQFKKNKGGFNPFHRYTKKELEQYKKSDKLQNI